MVVWRAFKVEREDIRDGKYDVGVGVVSDQSEKSVAHVSIALTVDQSVLQILHQVSVTSRTDGGWVWEDTADSSGRGEYAALKDIGAFSFLDLNKGIIQMQVTIRLTR